MSDRIKLPLVPALHIEIPVDTSTDISFEERGREGIAVWFTPPRPIERGDIFFAPVPRDKVEAMRDWMTAWLEATRE